MSEEKALVEAEFSPVGYSSPKEMPMRVIMQMANAVAKSKLFGISEPVQALSLMLLCQAKDIHPMIAVERYHIIQGRPSMKAEAMLADFLHNGGKVEWHNLTNERASATFSHPLGGTIELDWTIEDAKKAGLAGRDNWKNYPRSMLRSRLISEGIRTVYPVAVGVYTPEEIEDSPKAFRGQETASINLSDIHAPKAEETAKQPEAPRRGRPSGSKNAPKKEGGAPLTHSGPENAGNGQEGPSGETVVDTTSPHAELVKAIEALKITLPAGTVEGKCVELFDNPNPPYENLTVDELQSLIVELSE